MRTVCPRYPAPTYASGSDGKYLPGLVRLLDSFSTANCARSRPSQDRLELIFQFEGKDHRPIPNIVENTHLWARSTNVENSASEHKTHCSGLWVCPEPHLRDANVQFLLHICEEDAVILHFENQVAPKPYSVTTYPVSINGRPPFISKNTDVREGVSERR